MFQIQSAQDLAEVVNEIGFLPMSPSQIKGFSLREMADARFWFQKGVIGAWEWRESVTNSGQVVTGRMLENKLSFFSKAMFPHLANARRGSMDAIDLYEQGLLGRKHKRILDLLAQHGPMLSGDLCAAVSAGGDKGFVSTIAQLQMKTYVVIKGYEYKTNRFGVPYGMGSSRFALAEDILGEDLVCSQYDSEPVDSLALLAERIQKFFPHASAEEIQKFLNAK